MIESSPGPTNIFDSGLCLQEQSVSFGIDGLQFRSSAKKANVFSDKPDELLRMSRDPSNEELNVIAFATESRSPSPTRE